MLAGLEELTGDTVKHATAPLWSTPDTALIECLNTAHRLEQAAAALKLRLIRELDTRNIAPVTSWRSTAGWLREHLHLDAHTARDLVDLAAALDRHPHLDHTLSTGTIDTRQAQPSPTPSTRSPPTPGTRPSPRPRPC